MNSEDRTSTILASLERPAFITPKVASELVDFLADPQISKYAKAAITAAWKVRGEHSQDLYEIASYIRQVKLSRLDLGAGIADCCGTGGDNSQTFNISTCVALVAASAGIKVVKHGGRKTTSLSGSIDFLEALSIRIIDDPEQVAASLTRSNLVFLASPVLQNTLGDWKQICRELGFHGQTGLIGTLANPVRLDYQLLGVARPIWGAIMIEILAKQGLKRAAVVYGSPQYDELTTVASNQIWLWDGQKITERSFVPEDFGLERAHPDELVGGDSTHNLNLFEQIIEPGSQTTKKALCETIALNAGHLIWLAERAKTPMEGVSHALKLLQDGTVKSFYRNLKIQA